MKHVLTILFIAVSTFGFALTPAESLKRLINGNERFVNDQSIHPNRSQERREETAGGQKPFGIVLGCSDSRVPLEIIFDQGLGDLFVVRVAGNVAGNIVVDSIQYSAKYLGSSLIMVMGHESCGAVTAVFDGTTADIENIADLVRPAIRGAHSVESAVKDNVRSVVAKLKKCPELEHLMKEGKLGIVGAYYQLTSGTVEILKDTVDATLLPALTK